MPHSLLVMQNTDRWDGRIAIRFDLTAPARNRQSQMLPNYVSLVTHYALLVTRHAGDDLLPTKSILSTGEA